KRDWSSDVCSSDLLALLPFVINTTSPTPAPAKSAATKVELNPSEYFGLTTNSFRPFSLSSLRVAHNEPITLPIIIVYSPYLVVSLKYAYVYSLQLMA